jgi:hypothetical protein
MKKSFNSSKNNIKNLNNITNIILDSFPYMHK